MSTDRSEVKAQVGVYHTFVGTSRASLQASSCSQPSLVPLLAHHQRCHGQDAIRSPELVTGAVYTASSATTISLATIAKIEVDSVAMNGRVKSEHFPTHLGIYPVILRKGCGQIDLRLSEKLND